MLSTSEETLTGAFWLVNTSYLFQRQRSMDTSDLSRGGGGGGRGSSYGLDDDIFGNGGGFGGAGGMRASHSEGNLSSHYPPISDPDTDLGLGLSELTGTVMSHLQMELQKVLILMAFKSSMYNYKG